jgi:AraC-like DNA-binding protein
MIDLKKTNIEHVILTGNNSFKCFHYKVGINDIMPLHKHQEWELSLVIKGKGHRIIGDKLESAFEQELILLPPDQPHCWIFERNEDGYTENITVQFTNDLIARLGAFPEFLPIDIFFHHQVMSVEIMGDDAEKIKTSLEGIDEKDGYNRLMSLIDVLHVISMMKNFREISAVLAGNSKNEIEKINRIQKVYRYISSNYHHTIRLKDVADVACLSETSFSTFFKDITRCRFSEYLDRFRVEMAANLLLNNDDSSISDICYDVGFNDVPHFNRMFRRIKGCSPSEYCQQWKGYVGKSLNNDDGR